MGNFSTSQALSIAVDIQDAKFRCRMTNYQGKRPGGGLRSEIRNFSRQSRSRLLYKARNIEGLTGFITLTYPDEIYAETATGGNFMRDGKVIKEQLRRVRQWLIYRGLYGFWFLEFQKRGAPHLHICTAGGSLSDRDIAKLHSQWFKLVGSTCPHHKTRGVKVETLRKKEAAASYAAKYSAKPEQKTVPENYSSVGRFWGAFGDLPNSTETIQRPAAEVYNLARIARRWLKADSRAKGYKLRQVPGKGITGQSFYNCAPALRFYLSRVYILLENPSQIVLAARPWRSFGC